jgi:hypothetical protein
VKLAVGQVVGYHGRQVTVLDVVKTRTPGGESVTLVRVKDPRRGQRVLFSSQLEHPAPDRADFGSFR